VCVVPEQRGRGLGEGLLLASAQELRRRRFRSLSLTVTEANTRAVELYKRLGFHVARVFDAFVWEG
jgi:ribosomal protein S18 acetylase RimI-like enzyme